MDKKICPFNMDPCLTDRCAMYLKSDAVHIDEERIEGNVFGTIAPVPCALALTGLKAALDLLGLQPNFLKRD